MGGEATGVGNSGIRLPPLPSFPSAGQEGKAEGREILSPSPQLCLDVRWAQGGWGYAVILLGWSRKMKDDVRLIFSFIRQQIEMEGGEQGVGGWALHCGDQQGLEREGTGTRETP